MRELPDGIDVSALDDACYEYHREYVTDWDADHLAPRVEAIRDALGLGDAQPAPVLRHAVREWMDADRDYSELRATIVSDLRILADRDEVTTGDIHALADEIESGGEFGPVSPAAAVTPEPAEPRAKPILSAPNSEFLYREDEHGRVEAARADRPDEWGTTGWSSMAAVAQAIGPLTEVAPSPVTEEPQKGSA